MSTFNIWMAGYAATGEKSTAQLLAENVEADNFRAACVKYGTTDNKWSNYFDSEKLTYWGCTLHDNESDARKEFD